MSLISSLSPHPLTPTHSHSYSPTSYTLLLLVWTTCPYYPRDGQFNPDARTVNNIGDFDSMSNAVLFNSLAWGISPTNSSRSTYSSRVTTWIKAWFLDADTYMNPNLNYAQMQRGPGADGQVGTHTGIL